MGVEVRVDSVNRVKTLPDLPDTADTGTRYTMFDTFLWEEVMDLLKLSQGIDNGLCYALIKGYHL